MRLLKLSVLLSVFMLSVSFCHAQKEKAKKTVEQKSVEMTQKLHKEVKLNKIQSEKVKEINIIYLEKKEALETKIKALEKSKKKLKTDRNAEIDAILTKEQKEKQEYSKKKGESKRKK